MCLLLNFRQWKMNLWLNLWIPPKFSVMQIKGNICTSKNSGFQVSTASKMARIPEETGVCRISLSLTWFEIQTIYRDVSGCYRYFLNKVVRRWMFYETVIKSWNWNNSGRPLLRKRTQEMVPWKERQLFDNFRQIDRSEILMFQFLVL